MSNVLPLSTHEYISAKKCLESMLIDNSENETKERDEITLRIKKFELDKKVPERFKFKFDD